MRRLLLGAIIAAAVIACDNSLDPLPFEVDLQASRVNAAPGDTSNFLVIAQGGNLIGATMDYADSTADQFATAGARTAHITFRHAFSVTGTFRVMATVADAVAGQKSASIDVVVK